MSRSQVSGSALRSVSRNRRDRGGLTRLRSYLVPLTLGLALVVSGCEVAGPTTDEILWDTWGVPHVYGTSNEALFRGFGWAQAKAHGDLLLRLYGQARGRAAEYWGEEYLDSDRWVRTVDVPGTAERWLRAQDPDFRGYLEAFAAGINAYGLEHNDELSAEARRVLPVSAVDVLAHGLRALHYTFVVNAGVTRVAERALVQSMADGRAGSEDSGRRVVTVAGAPSALRTSSDPAGGPGARGFRLGSNAWAVAPPRTAGGNALLLANPHLPWNDLFTWFEAHLVGPDLDLSGATLVGTPVLAIAFNDRLGWTHTVNTYDGADLYLVEREGEGYRFDGEVRDFEIRTETIRVRDPEGGPDRTETLTVRSTVHGPVVAATEDGAAALRVAGLDASGVVHQWWDMGRARSFEAFENALRRHQMPMFNVIYADADGRVLYLYAGQVPARPRGDVAYWAGPVPGDTSATLWRGIHPYEDLPRIADPSTGWLQNANDPPWTATLPRALDRSDYPGYLAPDFMHFRAQRSAGMLLADSSVTFDELVEYKHSTRLELADRILDDLLPLAAEADDAAVMRAGEVLGAWDRRTDADSRGAVLFLRWVERWLPSAGFAPGPAPGVIRARAFAEAWEPERPVSTPDGIADPAVALEALAEAASAVEEAYGAMDVAWGDVYRLRRGRWDLPANGLDGDPGGVFRVVGYREAGDGTFTAAFGDSWVAAVEFGEDVRARALLSYGNWSREGSSHAGDQLELFSRQELRPVWRGRAEVEANLESREVVPGPGR